MRGSYIATSWQNYPRAVLGQAEKGLLEWFAANVRSGETWLDVGAYCGYTALALCRLVGSSGRVFAFEPVLETAGHLASTRSANRLEQLMIVPFALGNCDELMPVMVPSARGMAAAPVRPAMNGATEPILIIALDHIWDRLCGDRAPIHGVKIDVQGAEVDVLKGMANLLIRHRPKLVVEIHPGVDRSEFLEAVESVGYLPQGQPVDRQSEGGEVTYLDDRSYVFHAPVMA